MVGELLHSTESVRASLCESGFWLQISTYVQPHGPKSNWTKTHTLMGSCMPCFLQTRFSPSWRSQLQDQLHRGENCWRVEKAHVIALMGPYYMNTILTYVSFSVSHQHHSKAFPLLQITNTVKNNIKGEKQCMEYTYTLHVGSYYLKLELFQIASTPGA